jgi:hypothetical protein
MRQYDDAEVARKHRRFGFSRAVSTAASSITRGITHCAPSSGGMGWLTIC